MKTRATELALAGAMTTAVALFGIVVLGEASETDLWRRAERIPLVGTAGLRTVRAVVRKVVNP